MDVSMAPSAEGDQILGSANINSTYFEKKRANLSSFPCRRRLTDTLRYHAKSSLYTSIGAIIVADLPRILAP